MDKFFRYLTLVVIGLLILFALAESIGRIGDLKLAKERPELFDPDSHHIHYVKNALIMYIHVIAGMIFLITGVYQLIPFFRKNHIGVHRILGRIFLIISFIVSISAIVLALVMPYGNILESISNLIFGTFILFCTLKAYTSIRKKQITKHSNWVKRVFFISLSIATIRIIMIVTMLITNESIKEVMGRSFVIGFLLHAVLAELWILKKSKKQLQ